MNPCKVIIGLLLNMRLLKVSTHFPICRQTPELWKQYIFEVADRNSVTGEQAQIWCKQAGDFYQRCMYHAIQREETSLMKQFPLGKERELIAEIQKRLSDVGEIKTDPLSQTLPARILAKRFVSKWQKNKSLQFSKEHCGTADEYYVQMPIVSH